MTLPDEFGLAVLAFVVVAALAAALGFFARDMSDAEVEAALAARRSGERQCPHAIYDRVYVQVGARAVRFFESPQGYPDPNRPGWGPKGSAETNLVRSMRTNGSAFRVERMRLSVAGVILAPIENALRARALDWHRKRMILGVDSLTRGVSFRDEILPTELFWADLDLTGVEVTWPFFLVLVLEGEEFGPR